MINKESISIKAENEWKEKVKTFPKDLNNEEIYKLYAKERRELYKKYRELPTLRYENESLLTLKNKYIGERIFLLGNGPSLNKTPLELLEREFTFGVNRIYLLFDRISWRPTFYTINDWEVGPDNASEIKSLDGMIKFFPTRFRGLFKNERNVFWYSSRNRRNKDDVFSYNLTNGAVMGGTVMSLVIQIAYYMGFNPIYLIGCDVDYKINETVTQEGKYFSNGNKQFLQSTVDDDPNHFDPRYFGKGKRWHNPNVETMVDGFEIARSALEKKKINFFNATVGGKLEALKRIPIRTLFPNKRRMQPDVSIIMPAYNAEKLIAESIESVLNQTYTNWELIIVNDGSVDNTKNIILSFNDPRIILINQDNKGRSGARNTALKKANGEYIAFLDADDLYSPKKLEKQVKFLSANERVDAIVGSVRRISENRNIIREANIKEHEHIPTKKFFFGNPAHMVGTMIRRSAVGDIKFNTNAKAGEDWEFFLKLATNGVKFFYHELETGSYRFTQQAINKTTIEYANNMVAVLDRAYENYKGHQEYESYKKKAYLNAKMRMASRLFSAKKFTEGMKFFDEASLIADDLNIKFYNFAANQICFWLKHLDVNNPEDCIKNISLLLPKQNESIKMIDQCCNTLKISKDVCKQFIDLIENEKSKHLRNIDNSRNHSTNNALYGLRKKKLKRSNFKSPLFIVGNGSSLKEFNFDKLKDFHTFGMNAAFRYWNSSGFYPKYYICLDTVVTESLRKEIYKLILNKYYNNINLFFLRKNILQYYPELENFPEVIFYEDYEQLNIFKRGDKITTGSFSALFGALLGYKIIYLLGIDLNYIQKIPEAKNTEGCILEMTETPRENPNYFISDYHRKGDRYNIPDSFPDLHYNSWVDVKNVLDKLGVYVFNCNNNSFLDIFNCIDINVVINKYMEMH